jgi:hypothetical protein
MKIIPDNFIRHQASGDWYKNIIPTKNYLQVPERPLRRGAATTLLGVTLCVMGFSGLPAPSDCQFA